MLRVDEAMAYLQRSVEVDRPDYRYAVRVRRTDSRGEEGRGLYLRDPLSDGCVEAQVTVEPRMREDADVGKIGPPSVLLCPTPLWPLQALCVEAAIHARAWSTQPPSAAPLRTACAWWRRRRG